MESEHLLNTGMGLASANSGQQVHRLTRLVPAAIPWLPELELKHQFVLHSLPKLLQLYNLHDYW